MSRGIQAPLYQRYHFLDPLGFGGFSKVMRAYDRATGNYVAVKVSTASEGNPAAHEAMITALLRHAHIIHLIDSFRTRRNWYLVYELCHGRDLFTHIATRGRLPEDDARLVTATLVQAIAYLHSYGIVHRDIKPENILYRHSGRAPDDLVLADFGLAAFVGPSASAHVKGGTFSMGYASPEVMHEYGYTRACDMWSLGVTVYNMLSGRAAFSATTADALRDELASGQLVFPARYWFDISPEALDFVRRCLAYEPAARLTAAEALSHTWLNGSLECRHSSSSSSSTPSTASGSPSRSSSTSTTWSHSCETDTGRRQTTGRAVLG